MDEKQRDVIEINTLREKWRNIKKKKLADQIGSLSKKLNELVSEYADGIVEMYRCAYDEELVIQNAEYLSDTQEMMISLYAKDGISQNRAVAFADEFNQKYGTNLVAEVYSENEFAYTAKTRG